MPTQDQSLVDESLDRKTSLLVAILDPKSSVEYRYIVTCTIFFFPAHTY